MADATYSTDLTALTSDPDTGESTNNWAALGGGAAGLNVETEYFIQGSNCISKNAWGTGTKGQVEDTTGATLTASSGNAVYTWVTHHTPGSLDLKSNGGITICMGSSANTLNRYYYAGSDTVDYGAPWICAVVDPDQSTQASGTVTTANINTYGAEAALPTAGPTKGSPFGVDAIRYGRSIRAEDGVGGVAATFTGLAAANDAVSARWGQFQRTPGSTTNFTLQARIQFGNGAACNFEDSNKNITINDLEHVASGFIEFDVTNSSDVLLNSCNLTAAAGANTRGNWATTSANSVQFTSCAFTNMGTFGLSSAYTVDSCTFRGCDQITLNGATLNGGTVAGSTVTGESGAVVLGSGGGVNSTRFERGSAGHAIEMIAPGDYGWTATCDTAASPTGIQYRTGVTGSPITPTSNGDEMLVISTDGTYNITVSTGTVPSVRLASGVTATVNIASGGVTMDVNVKDQAGANVQGAFVYIDDDLGVAGQIANTTTDASGNITQIPYSGGASTATLRVRKYGYKPYTSTISLTVDTATNVTLITDPQQT